MTNLNPSMRLKVKRDTFFLPDSNSSVYFRNNLSSFRMEGSGIDKWIEKLLPMFNGEHTLGNLTEGLPAQFRDRVYEIAEVLYQNGFIQDVSQDRKHQLTEQVLKKHASQIEFVNNFVDSGAYRFQSYRQAKVLAIGSGPILVSLVSSLIESGLSKFHVLITDKVPTNRQRLNELVTHARNSDPEVSLEEVTLKKKYGVSSWREILKPFDSILYVSQVCDIEELRHIHSVCREEKKLFLPAICLQQVGLAGPLVHPDSEVCWESAWLRLHKSVLYKEQQLTGYSSTAGAMLANVIVFELFKAVTGVTEPDKSNQFFLLDLDTMEGNWHPFIPHPLVTGRTSAHLVEDFDMRLKQVLKSKEPSELLLYFNQLTSEESGIFHIWEEGDLKQLPLAQCRVQAVNPFSEGPAELLPVIVCSGLTHEEALREAGLTGIEEYVSRMVPLLVETLPLHLELKSSLIEPDEFVGVGTGETFAECVCRGLQKCLAEGFRNKQLDQKLSVTRVQLSTVEDERCRYYLQALTMIQGTPLIGLGEEEFGFQVVWLRTNEGWYRSLDLNITKALRRSLQMALTKAQNQDDSLAAQLIEDSFIHLEEKFPLKLVIPSCDEKKESEILQSSVEVLKRGGKRLLVIDLGIEPFMNEKLAGVFGVMVREEEIR
ncbi:putative thiazole-containing bacteriocin maturation protein [Peribacillus alkalitolerans]|uniref:putative thiazole-containing bacteriocin maturation protein n=1 Tax=Peribacillus alkalitolerans TaxID=1550385 RepID=UPI0013D1BD40|nr:putative thiazole-containing bacteriocin maturation protein [Peribacillus alkalitolerans]